MNHQKTGLAVLARFPDVHDGEKPQAGANEAKGWGLLASSGRWISQALSIKLLAGMTLFLLVGAVLPFCIGKNSPPAEPSPAGDSVSTWHPKPAGASAKAAPAQTETVAMTVARRPVRISATAEHSPAPAALPPTAETPREPPAASTVAEAMMSNWSPPASADPQPTMPGAETSSADANRPAAVRSTEYQADARAGHRQGEPAAARFEGTIEGTKR